MSDENGDASLEADAPEDRAGDGSGTATGGELPEALDAGLGGRLDTVHRTLSTLGMRIDALVTSTTTYRSALTDRLTEYADLVTKLTRTQAADLEEYRRANERTVTELRRGLSSTEEVLERVGARIDSMLTEAESSDDQSRRMLAEVRSILDAQENLSRFLTESLDQFADRVVERISATQTAATDQIEALRSTIEGADRHDDALREVLVPLRDQIERIDAQLTDTTRDDALIDRVAALDERISALAQSDPAAAVVGHLDTLHSAIGLLATADQVGAMAADLRAQVIDLAGPSDDTTVVDHLTRIERELTSSNQVAAESWGEFAGLRAKVDAILETSANETGAVSHLLDEIREALLDVASGEVVGALWDEFRSARSSIDEVLLTVGRAEEAARAAAEGADRGDVDATSEATARMEALRTDVNALTEAVRDLLEQAEVVDESAEAAPVDAMMVAVAADVATLRRELSQGLVVEPSDALSGAVDQLRADVAALDDRLLAIDGLQSSLDALRSEVHDGPADDESSTAEETLSELRSVRAEIGSLAERVNGIDELQRSIDALGASPDEGASDAALAELRSVRDDLVGLRERIDGLAGLEQAVQALRDDVRATAGEEDADETLATAGHLDELAGEVATLRTGVDSATGDLRTVRAGVEEIIARLDEGFTLAEDESAPATSMPPEVADQLAALRDQMNAEFDALRDLVVPQDDVDDEPAAAPVAAVDLTPVTELLEHVRDDLAELPGRIEIPAPATAEGAAPEYATIDPDVVDLLREEIRTAGAVPDDLLDQLRQELVALRRRIKLRAEGEIFSDEQLELIADAVARRLSQ